MGHGVVVQEAEDGWCLDKSGNTYASIKHFSINTKEGCRALLHEVGNIDGVEGAQMKDNDTCEILYDVNPNADTHKKLTALQVVKGERMWAMGEGAQYAGTGGDELVSRASGNEFWTCWYEV